MRIFLINPPTTYEEQTSLVEPLGLCYLAAVAKAAGHAVAVHDMVSTRHANVDALFRELDAFVPHLVGLTAMTNAFGRALTLARAVKARYGATVVLGGWHVSGDPSAVREEGIDCAVLGEGEDAFLELIDYLEGRGSSLEDIAGLAFVRGGKVVVTPRRPRRCDLDQLPRPDRSDLPLHLYQVPALLCSPPSRMRTLTVQASRGCPYRCTFCQTPAVWGGRWARRDPASVVDEVEALVDTHPIDSFWVRDEEFTVNKKWVVSICSEMVRRGLQRRVSWGSFCRVDDIDEELAAALAEAGYGYGFMGLDAGEPAARERIQKCYRDDEARRAFSLFEALDVTTHGGWIIGFPWDTREGLELQFSWLCTLPMDMITITYALPFAGTPFAKGVKRDGLLLSRAWESFSEKEPVVRTPHIPTAELVALRPRFLRRFYARPHYLLRQLRRVLRRPGRARIFAEMLWHHATRTRYFGEPPWSRRSPPAFEVPARYFEPLASTALPWATWAPHGSTVAGASPARPHDPVHGGAVPGLSSRL